MLALRDRASDRRDARFDRGDTGSRARDVLFLANARVSPDLREPQGLLLVRQASRGHRELLLQPAHLEVVARHFSRHTHPHIVGVSLEAFGVGRCGADLGANAPKQIAFPERIEADLIGRHLSRLVREPRYGLVASIDARAGDGDRKAVERDVIEHGARLLHARDRHAHVVIGGKRSRHQLVEDRVLELLPPAPIERLFYE